MEQKNHGSPSFINIAVLLLFAVVIAVASSVTTYFFLSSKSNKQYPSNQSSVVSPPQTYVQPTSAPVATTTQTVPDETAGWKVYRNNVFGFSFKYPPAFQLQDNLQLNKNSISGPQPTLNLEDVLNDINFTLILNPEGYGRATANKTYITSYSNDKGIYVVREENSEFDPQYHNPDRVVILNDSNLRINNYDIDLSFSYSKNNPETETETTFKQILSTFKFLK